MQAGQVVGARFRIEKVAGVGGMGTVYRAIDTQTNAVVALKVLHSTEVEMHRRFAQEAELLAQLRHPAIVGYVAHGVSSEGQPWLAMDWLEGEDLATRLQRGRLSSAEAVLLLRRVCEGLAVAHARGVVHRDLKPGNIFLPNGELARARVLDFGIARVAARSGTRTGVILGTACYMAPEQARGDRSLDARADVFSLGALLFELLVGEPPFVGHTVLAVLGKVLLEDPPPLSKKLPAISPALETLCARMLCKHPEGRPRDAADVLLVLEQLSSEQDLSNPVVTQEATSVSLTMAEQRLVSVVLVADDVSAKVSVEHTVVLPEQSLREAVAATGAQLDTLIDGSLIAVVSHGASPHAQVCAAARCALLLRAHRPNCGVVLATGRASVGAALPVGAVLDRAGLLLRESAKRGEIRVDAVTSELLDDRFVTMRDEAGVWLQGERDDVDEPRNVLGQPSQFLGRWSELGLAVGLFQDCVEERSPRALLLLGGPGVGKTRLRQELLRRIREESTGVAIWRAQGTAYGSDAALGVVAQWLRSAIGVSAETPAAEARTALRAWVFGRVGVEHALIHYEALAELLRFGGEATSPEFLATKDSPAQRAEFFQRAWNAVVQTTARQVPLVLVLEDAQYCDRNSLQWMRSLLDLAKEEPIFFLAAGRNEFDERHGAFWNDRRMQRVVLAPFSPRISVLFVERAFARSGRTAMEQQRVALAERSQGNPFFLEELVRAWVSGVSELPDTVLGMLQQRLDQLRPELRRVLRAAAIHGENFHVEAISVLLGADTAGHWLRGALEELQAQELIVASGHTSEGALRYSFASALIREVAYASLTDEDRRLGHQLAARWLDASLLGEALRVAEHFERGGEPEYAARALVQAVAQNIQASDFDTALQLAERGVHLAKDPRCRADLRGQQLALYRWRGESTEAIKVGLEMMELLSKESPEWFSVAVEVAAASAALGNVQRLQETMAAVGKRLQEGAMSAAQLVRCATLAHELLFAGQYRSAEQMMQWLERVLQLPEGSDASVAGVVHSARAAWAMMNGDTAAYLERSRLASASFVTAGDARRAVYERGNVGFALAELGNYAEARTELVSVMQEAERLGLVVVVETARQNLGMSLARSGHLEEAIRVQTTALSRFEQQGDVRMEAGSRIYLAEAYIAKGDFAKAEEFAKQAAREAGAILPSKVYALSVLARALHRSKQLPAALAVCDEAWKLFETLGSIPEGEATLRVVRVELLRAVGRIEEANATLKASRTWLEGRAACVSDEGWRRCFLEQVPEHRTLRSL